MSCSEFDFICQLQAAILAFLAAHWMAIVLGFVGLFLLVFAPLKWKLLGAAVLILLYVWYFGLSWVGVPAHFGWSP